MLDTNPKRKRDGPVMFWLLAIVLLATLLLVDDVILYFFIESLFDLHPTFGLRFMVALLFLSLNLGLMWLVIKLQRQKPRTGREAMIGQIGVVASVHEKEIWVRVHGELWRARCEARVSAGASVAVQSVDGLLLAVKPLE